MPDYDYLRRRMVEKHLKRRGIEDPRVLEALGTIPRQDFVPGELAAQAYGDHALPIGADQTISQPWVVARMTEVLDLDAEHSVLEIGTGSGYQTAILSLLVRRVYSLERVPELARVAIRRMRALGRINVKIQIFDGTVGWSEVAPFDRILVTAGAPAVPKPLLDQLAPGGKLLIPEGNREGQRLTLYVKNAKGKVSRQTGDAVTFVPLVGRHGWPDGKKS